MGNAIKFFDYADSICKTDSEMIHLRNQVTEAACVNLGTWYAWKSKKHIASARSRARIAELLSKTENEIFD